MFSPLAIPYGFAIMPAAKWSAVCFLVLCVGFTPGIFGQKSDRMDRAVVQLLAIGPASVGTNRECGGTGFFVNEEGYILTNAHVLTQAQRCLSQGGGTRLMAKLASADAKIAAAVSCDVVALDEVHDVAVIRAERPPGGDIGAQQPRFLELDTSEIKEGARVSVTGHPLFAWTPVTQSGKVIRRGSLRLSDASAAPTQVLVLNIPLRPGNSGSPVCLAGADRVVGIIESQERSQPPETVALPIRYAIELLDRCHVSWHASREPQPSAP